MAQKTVVITGSSKGIGAAIAKCFYDDGYSVVVSGRTDTGIAGELGDNACFVSGDVRQSDCHHGLIEAALEKTGRMDVYINCAGVSIWRPCVDVDEDFYNLLMDTNAKGTFLGCQAAARHFLKSKANGVIVNVSSLAGKRGSTNNSVYCASKFAVNGITQSLAKEFGPSGIRVNAVCPVYVKTEALASSLSQDESPAKGQEVNSFLGDFAAASAALGRIPLASEVADLCLYLASEKASAVTGQCINVDCGVLPQ